jgi:predicted PurR-regulated permease PerM
LPPFLLGAILAYLGDPIVIQLQRLKIPRTLAVTVVFLFLFLVLLLLLLLLVPMLERQIALLINRLPLFFNWLQTTVLPWLNSHLNLSEDIDVNSIKSVLAQHWQQAGDVVNSAVKTITASGRALLAVAVNIILVPIVTFYLLRDWDKVTKGIRALIPRRILPMVTQIAVECNQVVGAFFRGQLLVMFILGIFYTIGLSLIGFDFALLIALVIAILSIVPYLGSIAGFIISCAAVFMQFHDWKHIVYTLIVFVLGHILEGMVLTPWLIGDRIGLHPVAVIFAILVGGDLFGFIGVLVALPVAAIIMVLLRHLNMRYMKSKLYLSH